MKKNILYIIAFLFVWNANGQAVDNPCSYTAGSELAAGDCGIAWSTAGFTDLLDMTCGSALVPEGWFWYDGANAQVSISVSSASDIKVQVLEGVDADPCAGFYYGACADAAGAGGTETILGGGSTGIRYMILIENAAGTGTVTGTICVTAVPPSCTDGIQNGLEEGIDCSDNPGAPGECSFTCPPPGISGMALCTNAETMISTAIDCGDVGTAAFTGATGVINITAAATDGTAPHISPGSDPDCGAVAAKHTGRWVIWDPSNDMGAATVSAFDIDAEGEQVFAAFYQLDGSGTNCTSDLQLLECDLLSETIGMGAFATTVTYPISLNNVDGTEPIYAWIWLDNDKKDLTVVDMTLVGSSGIPTNDVCATPYSVPTYTEGCNLSSTGSSFAPPSTYSATICDGGTWYSNENTVYYSFQPTSATDTLSIENVNCDNGQQGVAQFGVWETCADLADDPTTDPGFLGCAVGNGDLNLSGLDPAATYIIVVDGNAGATCVWNFVGTIVTLELTRVDFEAKLNDKNNVNLNWDLSNAASEGITSVTLEKGDIDFNYKELKFYNNIDITKKYEFTDEEPFNGINNYRLKFVHNSGKLTYSEVKQIKLNSSFNDISIVPNPVLDVATISFNSNIIGSSELSIIDARGAEIRKQSIYVVKGQNSISLDTKELSSGIYVAALKGNSGTEVKRFVKK